MREIKFRALSKADNQMFGVEYMKLDGGKVPYVNGEVFSENSGWVVYELEDDDDFKLMQYTGLKDKNGTEIYESDIVKIHNRLFDFTGKIIFDKCFYLIDFEKINPEIVIDKNFKGEWLEVIGDIYNNKEFLKE